MTKDYILQQAKLATGDYKLARTAEERQEALSTMHRLTDLAAQLYGFEFADSLPWGKGGEKK